jgi:hypothetical protein
VLHRQDLDEHSLNAFRKEVEIVSRIFHPNILLYMGACTIPGHMCIITELMHKGDLESLLHDEKVALDPSHSNKQLHRHLISTGGFANCAAHANGEGCGAGNDLVALLQSRIYSS